MKDQPRLELVLSTPLPDYAPPDYELVFTRSFVCILHSSSDERFQFKWIALSQPSKADSILLELHNTRQGANMLSGPGVLAERERILSRIPVGDTSGMKRLGGKEDAERWYVIDLSASRPETEAVIEGTLLDYEPPYLLVLTEGPRAERLSVLDVERMEAVLSRPLDREDWAVRLTPDGRLLCCDTNLREVEVVRDSSDCAYQRVEVGCYRLDADEEDVRPMLIPLGFFRTSARSGLEPPGFSFRGIDGRALFLQPAAGWGVHPPAFFDGITAPLRYIVHTRLAGHQPGRHTDPLGYFPPPALSDLETPPRSVTWLLSRQKGWRLLDWRISPGRRWLVMEYRRRYSSRRRLVLAPLEVLTDSAAFRPEALLEPPTLGRSMEMSLLPGEETAFICKRDSRIKRPELFACTPGGKKFALLADNERSCEEVFFSPDGRYVGYVCRIRGREGYMLRVRRIP